jgi:site-specific recombinase XerD
MSPLQSNLPLPRLSKPLPKDVPSLKELGRLLRFLKSKGRRLDAAIIATLFACGLRRQELIDLKPEDYDAKESEVRVKSGKGGKGRTVPIIPWAAKLLTEYIEKERPSESQVDRLFLASNGKPLTGDMVGNRVKKACRDAGLKDTFSPHTLRHAFCIYLLRGGAGLRVVNELAGHTKLSATARYTRLTPSDLQNAVRKTHPRS